MAFELTNEQRERYAELGYLTLRNVIPMDSVRNLERAIVRLHAMQARKLTPIYETMSKPWDDHDSYDDIEALLEQFEAHDMQAQYQVFLLIPRLAASLAFQSLPVFRALHTLNGARVDDVALSEALLFFINRPRSKRLLSPWHNGQHAYPRRHRFVTLWMPLFARRHAGNGSLMIAEGSHRLGEVPFTEVRGFDDSVNRDRNSITRMLIPDEVFQDCPQVTIDASPGDVVMFQPRTIHRSTYNPSDRYTFACGFKLWDASLDYTVGANIQEQPYRGPHWHPGSHGLRWVGGDDA